MEKLIIPSLFFIGLLYIVWKAKYDEKKKIMERIKKYFDDDAEL